MQCILHWNYVQNVKRILHTQVSTKQVTKQESTELNAAATFLWVNLVLHMKESGEWRGSHLGDLDDTGLFEELGEALVVDVVGPWPPRAAPLSLLRNFRGGLDGFLLIIIIRRLLLGLRRVPPSWSDSSGTSDPWAAPGSAKSSAAAEDEEDSKESDVASGASGRRQVERMWRRGVDGKRRRTNGAEEEGEGLGRKALWRRWRKASGVAEEGEAARVREEGEAARETGAARVLSLHLLKNDLDRPICFRRSYGSGRAAT
uniref:Uncharacterized protein n=1 Tax=Oryza glumipatula TaxID=40148 RepID=A0A0E0AL39_9ORYZ